MVFEGSVNTAHLSETDPKSAFTSTEPPWVKSDFDKILALPVRHRSKPLETEVIFYHTIQERRECAETWK